MAGRELCSVGVVVGFLITGLIVAAIAEPRKEADSKNYTPDDRASDCLE